MAEYIEREAIEKFIEDGLNNPDSNKAFFSFDAVEILEEVHYMPAADVAPVVHGRWIFKYEMPYKRRKGYCSVCGQHSGIGGIQKNQEKPFCPNCGAKMDGGQTSG